MQYSTVLSTIADVQQLHLPFILGPLGNEARINLDILGLGSLMTFSVSRWEVW